MRTLGLVVLYDLERVDVLPDIATLAEDDANVSLARTAPRSAPRGPGILAHGKDDGAEIRHGNDYTLLRTLCRVSGLRPWPIKSDDLRKTLAEFAAKRDPILCTPAFLVAMDRATGGISPIQEDRRVTH